ncbi:MAG: TRAP transporter small permease [Epsilonproteobacteria bacterium]|nr:TRAP transporter small permease [Campylobacterota bacterium]
MRKISTILSKICDAINKQISLFVVLLLFLLSLLLGVNVFYRYVLNDSIYWSNEVARYLLAYIVFLGATMAHKSGVHIRIDMIFMHISQKSIKVIDKVISIFFILFWALVLYGSIKLFPLFMMQTTATLQIPYAVPFAALPISAVIWMVYCLDDLLKKLEA